MVGARLFYPPGPRHVLPMSNLLAMRRDPLAFLSRLAQQYGDIAHFKIGSQHLYLFSHPELIRDVLVTHNRFFHKGRALQRTRQVLGNGLLTSEGDFHLRQRRLIQPAFHRQRIAAYGDVMASYARRVEESWRDGITLDISEEMMRLTMEIVAKTLFNADVRDEADQIDAALGDLMRLFQNITLPFSELLERLPLPGTRRMQQARARLDDTIFRMIAEHRASGDQGDLLSMLLMAQDEEGAGAGMSDVQVRDEALTLFLAGHETTANALTWTWYLLSQHPEVEARLHAEVDDVLQGRLPSAADLERLPYTRMVLSESMRMYPPAWVVGRLVLQDYRAGGYTIPAGAIILMSQYVVHRQERFFPHPERFDPLRWTPEAQAARPRFSYFPFGGGPRICIGESFAWMEGVLVLATIAQRWRFRLLRGHPVAAQPLITLRTRYGMDMIIEKRF